MVQNFFAWMLTGIVIGLIVFGIWRLIKFLIKKHKEKKVIDSVDDDNNIIDIK